MTGDIDQLNACGFAWYITRGRTRPGEPLYAVGLSSVDDDGISTGDDFAFIVEDDDLHACVIRAVGWAQQQTTKKTADEN